MLKKIPKTSQIDLLKTLRGVDARERLLHRLHSIALVLGGLPAKEVARLYGDSPRAVAYWVTKFQIDGIKSLEDKARSGRPTRLDASQMKLVREFVTAKRGKNESVTGAILAAHIQSSFGIELTERQCWRILRNLDV